MLSRKELLCIFLSIVLVISSLLSSSLFTLSLIIGGNNSSVSSSGAGFATFPKAYAQTTTTKTTGFAPQSNAPSMLQFGFRQQQRQQMQMPSLSYPYNNNNNNNRIRGTPGLLPSSSPNNKIVTAAATARGIPNQFIVMLKDSLDSTTASSSGNSNTDRKSVV